MGFSIGKVFTPIENAMKAFCEVDSIYLPRANYSPLSLWQNIRYALKKVRSEKYDIIHITGAEHYLLPFLRDQKSVVTVHDLGFYTNLKQDLRTALKKRLWIDTLKYATRVTFISDKSKIEAENLITLKPDQASVIFNPVGAEYTYTKKKFNSSSPVILHIGTKSNKNLHNTIIALSKFKCTLRIVGKLTPDQISLLEHYNINYENVFDISNEDILKEYQQCDIVNFPSFYEGFGMPIIEGEAVGRVVITSNISPMKEVANGSAILVDPHDVKSLDCGYHEALTNYDKYIQLGLKNINNYSMDIIVKQYADLYKRILK